ncbi:DUF4922 domain-containing protein [Puteibacter caeruleilacunae]|nr:DUF4922 domain-containing protein [Puteibacter caeruleilacunae]
MHLPLLDQKELKLSESATLSQKARMLIQQQVSSWDLAKTNYEGLKRVKVRNVEFDNCSIRVQFNPERIRSSAAKVDAKSIQERACFLCARNLPKEQKGILYDDQYLILVNPFPIFNEHLTIPDILHADQDISCRLKDMLLLARELDDFVVFYNGPRCGASAPDHFHFQAGIKGFMPIEEELVNLEEKDLVLPKEGCGIYMTDNYLRKVITVVGEDIEMIAAWMREVIGMLYFLNEDRMEPMMNILCSYDNGEWRVHFFPRRQHRPKQYFDQGEKQILISPASVDFGGVFITPREEDFVKIKASDIEDIFEQVTLSDEDWKRFRVSLLTCL